MLITDILGTRSDLSAEELSALTEERLVLDNLEIGRASCRERV